MAPFSHLRVPSTKSRSTTVLYLQRRFNPSSKTSAQVNNPLLRPTRGAHSLRGGHLGRASQLWHSLLVRDSAISFHISPNTDYANAVAEPVFFVAGRIWTNHNKLGNNCQHRVGPKVTTEATRAGQKPGTSPRHDCGMLSVNTRPSPRYLYAPTGPAIAATLPIKGGIP